MAFLVILKFWAHIVTFWLTCACNFNPRFILDLSSFIFFNLELPPLLSPTSSTKILKHRSSASLCLYKTSQLVVDCHQIMTVLGTANGLWCYIGRSEYRKGDGRSNRPVGRPLYISHLSSLRVCFSVSVFKRSRLCFRVNSAWLHGCVHGLQFVWIAF